MKSPEGPPQVPGRTQGALSGGRGGLEESLIEKLTKLVPRNGAVLMMAFIFYDALTSSDALLARERLPLSGLANS